MDFDKGLNGYDAIADCFQNAKSTVMCFGSTRYFGKIQKWLHGQAVVFKVNAIDQELVALPDGFSGIQIKVTEPDDMVRIFHTKIISKRLPKLLLEFPDKEAEKIERFHPRIHAFINTVIVIKRRPNDVLPVDKKGMGTIENISEGGCSFSTQLNFKTGDVINFHLPVKEKDNIVNVDLQAIVRNVEKIANGTFKAGVQFKDLEKQSKDFIKSYMDRRLQSKVSVDTI